MESARFSPSAGNMQRLRFRPVYKQDEVDYLYDQLAWAGYLKDWDGPIPEERPTSYILIMTAAEIGTMLAVDMGICAQSIMLTAVSEGLGGCMLGSFHRERTNQKFASEGYQVGLVLALGKPVERVVLEDTKDNDIHYYREADGTHHVPKLPLDTLIIE